MSILIGRTAIVLGKLTIWKNGIVKEGFTGEGSDYAGVRICLPKIKDINDRESIKRVSFTHERIRPTWWNTKHDIAVQAYMQSHIHELKLAAIAATRDNRIDTSPMVNPSAIPNIG